MKKYCICIMCSILLLISCNSNLNTDELKLVTNYLSDHGLQSNKVFNLAQNMQNSENFPFNEKTSSWNYLVRFVKNENANIDTNGYNVEVNHDSFSMVYDPVFILQEKSKASTDHLAMSSKILTSNFEEQLIFLNDFEKNNEYFITNEKDGKLLLQKQSSNEITNDWNRLITYLVYLRNNKENQLDYSVSFYTNQNPTIVQRERKK